jgi:hypothetical protein
MFSANLSCLFAGGKRCINGRLFKLDNMAVSLSYTCTELEE